jgi:RNA polymerase sigma-70 factor (ECF subfamily)
VHELALDPGLVNRLHHRAGCARWQVSATRFAQALEASARVVGGSRDQEGTLSALHLEDLALSCACADGNDAAWDHFVLQYRPHLYRAAAALDARDGGRELADSLYADLFGLRERDGVRQSLFSYFHGRSSLTTWLRAVLTQRHIDRLRAGRKLEALPDEESPDALRAPMRTVEPDLARYLALIRSAFERVVASLQPRDRLRLACYYAQELTLAQTGQLLGEHEATTSRQLAKTRQQIKADVDRQLRVEHALTDAEVTHCFTAIAEDAGSMDLRTLMHADSPRKDSALDRSNPQERV